MRQHLEKRSLALSGHKTSIALELPFWLALEALATQRGLALAALLSEIDRSKPAGQPLASAARVHALLQARHGQLPPP